MDLWIRSQNKEHLIKVGLITLTNGDDVTWYLENGDYILGTYKTKERALEVLNEIQNILKPKVIIEEFDNTVKFDNLVHIVNPKYETIEQLNTYVYEMPEE